MAALLVALGVMAVLMSAAMPVWKQLSQREKEAELIFRGQQYARAIGLFQRKSGPGTLPPSVDVLVQQRFLRAKYKDPITGQDFDLLSPVQATPAGAGRGASPTPSGRGSGSSQSPGGSGTAVFPSPGGSGMVVSPQINVEGRTVGGIIGVASKSKEKSIRVYNGRSHYNEWQFIYVQQAQAPGAPGAPGAGGQRGQQPPTSLPGVGTVGRGGRGQQGPPQGPVPFGGGRGPFPPGGSSPSGGGPAPRPPRN